MILASGGDPEAVLTLLHVDLSLPKIVYDVYGGNFGTVGGAMVTRSGLVGTEKHVIVAKSCEMTVQRSRFIQSKNENHRFASGK